MPITEKQLENRTKHIGSSDMAAILGLSPYKSAWDVWAEKTGKVEPRDISNEPAVMAGNLMENGVLDYAQAELGSLVRNQYRSNPDLHLGANVDAIVSATGEPVEAKTAGMVGPLPSGWGADGTDEVPPSYIVQCHVHLLALNGREPQVCHLPAFLGGRGFALYHIPRNEELCTIISENAVKFWTKHVLADVPPHDSLPAPETLARMKRVPQSVADALPPKLLDEYEAAKAAVKAAEEREKHCKAALLLAMGDAEAATVDGDPRALTYYEQTRSGLDTKALLAEHPELKEKFGKTTTFRVLRIKKKGL